MKLKFKTQAYQTAAVQAVVRCFAGQPKHSAVRYRVDAGQLRVGETASAIELDGFKNANVGIDNTKLLDNIRTLQREQQLPVSDKLVKIITSPINLDIEMETGTGKTYCYIKTMFELNEQFGWRKFIVVVPSIAIREGVAKSLDMTADYFLDAYGKKARFFIYNSKQVQLTRRTVAAILSGLNESVFRQFSDNPEGFIRDASRLIQEQKATAVIEHLRYDTFIGQYSSDIFTASQAKYNFAQAGKKHKRHIYDYLITDSKVERAFAAKLDNSKEVVVYAKLPKGFAIPTPVGDYNPDWAIAFKHGAVKHIYFVVETKGSMSSMSLRKIEALKIECARKFFAKINLEIKTDHVRYEAVSDYEPLIDWVS